MNTHRNVLSALTALSLLSLAGLAGCVAASTDDMTDDMTETAEVQDALGAMESKTPAGDKVAPTDELAPRDEVATPDEVAPPDDLSVTESAKGEGWRRLHFDGVIEDGDTGELRNIDDDVLVIEGSAAAMKAPLPPKTRQSILADAQSYAPGEEDDVIIVHEQSAWELEAQDATTWSSCSNYDKTYSKTVSLNRPFSHHKTSESGSFSGSIDFDGYVSASATGTLTLRVKQGWFFGCRPYYASFKRIQIKGNGNVTASVDANGLFEKQWHWSKQVAKPEIGKFKFSIGVLPIVLVFNAPIEVGVDASARARLVAKGGAQANGSFDVYCTSSTCSGTKSGSASYTSDGAPSIQLSGRVNVDPWAQASVRGYLYHEYVAYGQVGVRATLASDLWAYTGNTCGDADNDGVNEWVNALTLDVQGKLAVTAKAKVFDQEVYSNAWTVASTKHYFTDLIGSSALDPIFYQSANSVFTAGVRGRMRPCYPYTDAITYDLLWGDGSAKTTFSSAPNTLWTKSHTYVGYGTRTGTLTAVKDSAGRSIGGSRNREINVGRVAPTGGVFHP